MDQLPLSGLIPLFPMVGAFLWGLIAFSGGGRAGSASRRLVVIAAPGMVFLSFLLGLYYLSLLLGMPEEVRFLHHVYFPWIKVDLFRTSIAFQLDSLSIMLVLVITGVGFLIHVYSVGYMAGDESLSRYFAWLNLFTALMLVLVMADNLLLMFIGWEGVGLCSYLLIGFWFQEPAYARAGMKAFIVNRIGDAAFIAAMFLLFWTLTSAGQGSFVFTNINLSAGLLQSRFIFGIPAAELIAGLLFIGATGKSAQIPLYTWLPDAMAGPTPVSALIHAATMVTAGIYMIARLSGLFQLAPTVMFIVAATGVTTAFFAAMIAVTQHDIKKVLAYSTISQLGYMFLGVGVGAFSAGIFHLMTHAFFKALLFLGAGSVIMGMHHEQDMRRMGGLRKYMPVTAATYLIGVLAIAGVFPLSGFFSKDEILFQVVQAGASDSRFLVLYVIGMITAVMTAFYMFRSYFLTFTGELAEHPSGHAGGGTHTDDHADSHSHGQGHGEARQDHHAVPHESPLTVLIPLVVLAGLAGVAGLLNLPSFLWGNSWLHHWLSPVFTHGSGHSISESAIPVVHDLVDTAAEARAAAGGFAGALVGAGISWVFYGKNGRQRNLAGRMMGWLGPVHTFVFNKYYVDELYDRMFVRSVLTLSRAISWFDANIIDGLVNGIAARFVNLSSAAGWMDQHIVDGAVHRMTEGVAWCGQRARGMETGYLYHYVMYSVAGAAAIAIILISVN